MFTWNTHIDLMIVRQTGTPPSHRFERILQEMRSVPVDRLLVLGGADATLTATQRSGIVEFCKEHKPTISAVLESRVSRGTATALSWFVKELKVFGPNELEEALSFLRITGGERTWAESVFHEVGYQVVSRRGTRRGQVEYQDHR